MGHGAWGSRLVSRFYIGRRGMFERFVFEEMLGQPHDYFEIVRNAGGRCGDLFFATRALARDRVQLSVVGKGKFWFHRFIPRMCFGLLCPVTRKCVAKQLPALPGDGGEADGGQMYQSRWPSRTLEFRPEIPRGTRT